MPARGRVIRTNAWSSLVTAGLLLFYGFGYAPAPTGESGSDFYDATVHVMRYTAQAGGVALAGVAPLWLAGVPAAPLLEAILSAACGLVITVIAAYWTAVDRDFPSVIVVVFGLILAQSGWQAWRVWAGPARSSEGPTDADEGPPSEPSDVVAAPPEVSASAPPPATEGDESYLAALGRARRARRAAGGDPSQPSGPRED